MKHRKRLFSLAPTGVKSVMALALLGTLVACGGGSSSDSDSMDEDNQTAGESDNGAADAGSDSNNDSDAGTDTTGDTSADAGTADATAGDTNNNDNDSGDSDAGPVPPIVTDGNVTFYGSVDIDQNDMTGGAFFYKTNIGIPPANIIEALTVTSDSCTVTEVDLSTPPSIPDTPINSPGVSFESVSAGDVITITSSGGTFGELQRETFNGFVSYDTPEQSMFSGPVPAGSVVDIPGDEFPAFANVALPNVAVLSNISLSTGTVLTAASSLTWDANAENSSMYLSATSLPSFTDPNFDPTNFQLKSVTCSLTDDGSFSFPAAIASQMGADFSATDFSLSRDAYRFEQRGNALLTVSVSSSN